MKLLAATLWICVCAGCGFGPYDGADTPSETSASDGIPDAGQWWPWVCADGGAPFPASTPQNYVAVGSCGAGGAFALSVDGCEIVGSWAALGLSNVETVQFTSTPGMGGWTVSATGSAADGGATQERCTATGTAASALTFTCTASTPPATVCQSALTLVSSP